MQNSKSFFLLLLVVFCACGDDDTNFTEPSEKTLFVQSMVDGSPFEIIHLEGSALNGQIIYDDAEYPNQDHCLFTQYTNFAAYNNSSDEVNSAFLMEIGFVTKHFSSPILEVAPSGNLIAGTATDYECGDWEISLASLPEDKIDRSGDNAYAGIFPDELGNNDSPTEGVIINLYEPNGKRWTSFKADNSSSQFTITEWAISYYDEAPDGGNIAATFSCTVVDEDGNTKEITDGRMRGHFMW